MQDLLTQLSKKKQRLDAISPLPAVQIKNLDEWYRVELTYTSNAIEGNTLTRRETSLVVDKGLTIAGKSFIEHLEAVNHAGAVDFIKELASQTKTLNITNRTILDIHQHILSKIDDTNAGRYRNVPVRVAGSMTVFPNHLRVAELMDEFVAALHVKARAKTVHPAQLAAFAHFRLVSIHPFVDGNGRTARLLMNLILEQAGYPPAIIRKEDRLKYINALEQARIKEDDDIFYEIVYEAVDRSLDIYLGEDKPGLSEQQLLKIGDVARLSRETVVTIRHWTDEGLLDLAERTTTGYRLYLPSAVEQAKKIRQLADQRFTLAEIKLKMEEAQ